jgi:hypothetical protein
MEVQGWGNPQKEFALPAQMMILDEEGEYELRVFVAGAVLASRTLTVRTQDARRMGR